MGATQSTPGSSASSPKRGLHVLRVTSDSPAAATDLEPLFDFIVGIADAPEQNAIDPGALEAIVESHEEQPLNLLVWNVQTSGTRGALAHVLVAPRADQVQYSGLPSTVAKVVTTACGEPRPTRT
jgi:hypothetical protein